MLAFRRASLDDVPALVALIESAYRGEASRAGWTTEADLLRGQRTDDAEVRALVSGEHARFVLVEERPNEAAGSGEVRGSATDGGAEDRDPSALLGCVLLKDEGACAYVGMFSVRPTMQARGLGRALLEEAERIARDELRRDVVRMTVIAQRGELIAWYARRGYALTGRREPFPYHLVGAGDPLRDDLVFEVLEKRLG